jgi:hypothetical protein
MNKKGHKMQDKIVKSLLINQNIPTNWTLKSKELTPKRRSNLKDLVNRFPDKYFKLLISGNYPAILDILLLRYSIHEIQGINFPEYLDDVFNNTVNINTNTKLMVVYSVGVEKSLKHDFSTKVLKYIIEQCSNKGVPVIVGTNMSISEFTSTYNIDFVNNIVIHNKKEECIL